MQTNEEKKFRLSPQVLIMVAVVLLALALPVALSVHALQLAAGKLLPEPTTEELETEPLRQILEDLATEQLSNSLLDSDRMEIFLTAKDSGKEQARIEALARDYEATALPSTDSGGTAKVLVSIPQEKAGDFLRKLGAGGEVGRLPKEQSRIWIEIVVRQAES